MDKWTQGLSVRYVLLLDYPSQSVSTDENGHEFVNFLHKRKVIFSGRGQQQNSFNLGMFSEIYSTYFNEMVEGVKFLWKFFLTSCISAITISYPNMFVIILLCYGFMLLWLVNFCANFNLIKTEESVCDQRPENTRHWLERLTSWSCIYEPIDKTFQFLKVKQQPRSSQAPRNSFACSSCELFAFVYFWHCEFVI